MLVILFGEQFFIYSLLLAGTTVEDSSFAPDSLSSKKSVGKPVLSDIYEKTEYSQSHSDKSSEKLSIHNTLQVYNRFKVSYWSFCYKMPNTLDLTLKMPVEIVLIHKYLIKRLV